MVRGIGPSTPRDIAAAELRGRVSITAAIELRSLRGRRWHEVERSSTAISTISGSPNPPPSRRQRAADQRPRRRPTATTQPRYLPRRRWRCPTRGGRPGERDGAHHVLHGINAHDRRHQRWHARPCHCGVRGSGLQSGLACLRRIAYEPTRHRVDVADQTDPVEEDIPVFAACFRQQQARMAGGQVETVGA